MRRSYKNLWKCQNWIEGTNIEVIWINKGLDKNLETEKDYSKKSKQKTFKCRERYKYPGTRSSMSPVRKSIQSVPKPQFKMN